MKSTAAPETDDCLDCNTMATADTVPITASTAAKRAACSVNTETDWTAARSLSAASGRCRCG